MRPGYGIVVSPLISLMKDQVDSLLERNIPAAFINSTVPFGEQFRAARAAAEGEIKLLYVAPERFAEALAPTMVAISLSGEPTSYSRLPELVDGLNAEGYTTFLVSNGTRPDVLARCRPYQVYVSLDAPDRETYLRLCRPQEDYWDNIQESLTGLAGRRSAIRTTVVRGYNDFCPEGYAALYQDSGARFVEVKGYMYLGYSRNRLQKDQMPEHADVRAFAEKIVQHCDYSIRDESPASRVVCLERNV
jgi:tRNA wybutosine-synthesizing protein 1